MATTSGSGNKGAARPFVGMMWRCCGVYGRLYLRADGKAYAGRCPRCGKMVAIDAREARDTKFFEYS